MDNQQPAFSTGTRYEQRLGYAVQRATTNPAFLAATLNRYRRQRHWSWPALWRWLELPTLASCYRLALCLVPPLRDPERSQGIARIAAATGVTAARLTELLGQAAVDLTAPEGQV